MADTPVATDIPPPSAPPPSQPSAPDDGGLLGRIGSGLLDFVPTLVSGGMVNVPKGGDMGSLSDAQRGQTLQGALAFARSLANAATPTYGPAPGLGQMVLNAVSDAGETVAKQQAAAEQIQMADIERQGALVKLKNQMLVPAMFGQLLQGAAGPQGQPQQQAPAPGGAASAGLGAAAFAGTPGGLALRNSIIGPESGGELAARNKTSGASGQYQIMPGTAAAAGFYTPPQAASADGGRIDPWSGTFNFGNVPGLANVHSYQDFMNSPAAQDEAYKRVMTMNDQRLQDLGAYRYIGQTVGGVPITQEGLLQGAWLGGPNSVMQFLTSGGKTNPTDRGRGGSSDVGQYIARGNVAAGLNAQAPPPSSAGGSPATAGPPVPTPGIPLATLQALQLRSLYDPEGAVKDFGQMQLELSKRDQWTTLNPAMSRQLQPNLPNGFTLDYNALTGERKLSAGQPTYVPMSDADAKAFFGAGWRPGVGYAMNVATGKPEALDIPRMSYANTDTGQQGFDPRIAEAQSNFANNYVRNTAAFQNWQSGEQRYNALYEILQDPSRVADPALIENWMKIFDPAHVVPQGDKEGAQSFGGLEGTVYNLLSQLRSGQISAIPPDVRQRIWNIAQREMAVRDVTLSKQIEDAQGQAQRFKIPFPDGVVQPFHAIAATPDQARAMNGGKLPNPAQGTWADPVTWNAAQQRPVLPGDTRNPTQAIPRPQPAGAPQAPPAPAPASSPPPPPAPAPAPGPVPAPAPSGLTPAPSSPPPPVPAPAPPAPASAPAGPVTIPDDDALGKMTREELINLTRNARKAPIAPGDSARLARALTRARTAAGGY